MQNCWPEQNVAVGRIQACYPKLVMPSPSKRRMIVVRKEEATSIDCLHPSDPPASPMSISQGNEANAMLTWDIVNIAAIHKQVTVLGVAERRQIGGVRCTGPDVAPHAACRMKMEIQSKGRWERRKRKGAQDRK